MRQSAAENAKSRCDARGAGQSAGMRRLLIVIGALILAGFARAEDFTKTMTAEERTAAGLDRLTAEELGRLKAAVERYKTGEVAVVQQAAEQKVAVAEAKAEKIAKAGVEPAAGPSGEKKPGWLKALITLEKVGKRPDSNDAFESRFAGEFNGWRRGTIFNLENGQRWQQTGGEDYVTPPVPAPKVKIYPGAFSTFWMEIEGVGVRVRVKPLNLE
jgi:hypothetical protein